MLSREIQSKMVSFIGAPPVTHQVARLGVALAIIIEHSFYLWDRAPSNICDRLISAINVYQSSTKHATVTLAVDETFNAVERDLLKEAKGSRSPEKSTFAETLAQIALDNRLPPPQST